MEKVATFVRHQTADIARNAAAVRSQPDAEWARDKSAELGGGVNRRETPAQGHKRPPRVLMVEDNWDHAYLGMKALTVDGRYQVELASSGAEAIYKLSSSQFSLVLIDYCLSGMDGLSLVRKIIELGRDIPVVMITGVGSEMIAVEAMKLGVADYIIKSGNYLATLPLVIGKALEHFELQKVKEHWDRWLLKRNRELAELNALNNAINDLHDAQSVIAGAMEKTAEILGADYACMHLTESQKVDAVSLTQPSMTEPLPAMVRQVAESGESIVLESLGSESLDGEKGPADRWQSSIYIPLQIKRQSLGVLVIASRRRSAYSSQDMLFYNALGHQIAVAIENARLYEALKGQFHLTEEAHKTRRVSVSSGEI